MEQGKRSVIEMLCSRNQLVYSQLAMLMAQVCSSRGKRARCMEQPQVRDTLQTKVNGTTAKRATAVQGHSSNLSIGTAAKTSWIACTLNNVDIEQSLARPPSI